MMKRLAMEDAPRIDESSRSPTSEPLARTLLPCMLVLIASAAYLNSLRGSFLFDDTLWIVRNPALRHLWPLQDVLRVGATRPLVMLSLALNYAVSGLRVETYHLFNLTIHLLTTLVLYDVVRRTLQTPSLRTRYGNAAPWFALTVSLLWAVHPLLTQSVTYIIQRAELLMGLFYLSTLYCVVRGATHSSPRSWYTCAVLCCACGMASKAVMVTAPLMVGLYDRSFLAGSWRRAWHERRGLYLGLFASWVLLAVLLASDPKTPEPTAGFALKRITLLQYAFTQPGVILHYLKLAVWPSPLVFDYQWPIANSAPTIVLSSLSLAGLWVAMGWLLRRRAPLGFVIAWFLLTLAPTSSVVPVVDLAVEHRMYLPLIAVVVLVVITADAILKPLCATTPRRRWIVSAGAVSVLTVWLAAGTIRRNQDYRSELVMWNDVVHKRPTNARAHMNLGFALAQTGNHEAAMTQYEEALRLTPDDAQTHNNMGALLVQEGRFDEAIAHYRRALEVAPFYAEAYSNLGVALSRQGKSREAVIQLSHALRLTPQSAAIHYNLGNALATQGQWDDAILHYAHALQLEPGSANVHNNWGNVLALQGRVDEAIVHYAQALQLDPTHADARHNLERLRSGAHHGA